MLTPPTPGLTESPVASSRKWSIVYSAGRLEPPVCEAQVNSSIWADLLECLGHLIP